MSTYFVRLICALHDRRYWIAAAVFALCVALGINGSSIGMWCQYFGEPESQTLLGISRGIRSDEWALFTPLAFSQYFAGFGYFSDIVRAAPTDVFFEYGQPILSPLMVFRPFQIGYLFLPVDQGLAFFWCGRLIALFLVAYEFGRLLTGDRRLLSATFALMTAFAPVVQWWFSINGFVEMLIATMLSTLAFDRYLRLPFGIRRLGHLSVLVICAGTYALTVYPAWMVPLGYVLLALLAWRFVENRKQFHLAAPDWIALVLSAVVLGGAMLTVCSRSGETMRLLAGTIYPGQRFMAGGGLLQNFFFSVVNPWQSFREQALWMNACECAGVLDFFPLVWVLSVGLMGRQHRKDLLSVLLLAVAVFIGAYCLVGFPDGLAQVTFMGRSQMVRSCAIFGFCNLILLFRTLARMDAPLADRQMSLPLAAVLAAVPVGICHVTSPDYIPGWLWWVTFLLFAAMNWCLLRWTRRSAVVWMALAACVTIVGGVTVNPIRRGASDVRNLDVVRQLREIASRDPGAIWACDASYPIPNVMLLAGVPCINSTNIYPLFDRWRLLDPEGRSEDAYNRYAHINVRIRPGGRAEFKSLTPDQLNVDLSPDDLRKLDVKYVMSGADLSWATATRQLRLLGRSGNYCFYEVRK